MWTTNELTAGSHILLKIVSENRFSGKTYFYTFASRVNGAEVPPQLLESMEATVAREIAEERAQEKVEIKDEKELFYIDRWLYWAYLLL